MEAFLLLHAEHGPQYEDGVKVELLLLETGVWVWLALSPAPSRPPSPKPASTLPAHKGVGSLVSHLDQLF